MKIAGLVDALNILTDIPCTEWAWSEAPADGYGVVTADGQSELKADADPAAEKMLTGYVDVFIKATDSDPTEDVEDAMRAIGVWFRMESIQFEPESGFLHFEWRWVDTMNNAKKEIVESLPIMLHVIGTQEVTAGGKTYRKVTFADGEREKILEYAKTRDMIFCLKYWEETESEVWYWLRKTRIREDQNNMTEILFEAMLPAGIGEYTSEQTATGYTGMQVAVLYQNGAFYGAYATDYTSA